ncbi:Uncharacterised protein [Mycobacteroides abscessus subsp. abscessus]|nr:Uncharacterised protein [Mycobacteroides abscessus subsp. abscessus]
MPGFGIVSRASFMKCAYVESSPRISLMNGNTRFATMSNISSACRSRNTDQRRSLYGRPSGSFPSGNGLPSSGCASRFARSSARVCSSSRRRMNSRYVICSITSSGLEMPPVQNASQTASTLFLMSPVITGYQNLPVLLDEDQQNCIDHRPIPPFPRPLPDPRAVVPAGPTPRLCRRGGPAAGSAGAMTKPAVS